jgi:hypothetical protein
LGHLAQQRLRFVDDDFVSRRCPGGIRPVEVFVPELTPREIGRFLVMGNPEAEQRNTGSLADVGGLAKEASADIGPGRALRGQILNLRPSI